MFKRNKFIRKNMQKSSIIISVLIMAILIMSGCTSNDLEKKEIKENNTLQKIRTVPVEKPQTNDQTNETENNESFQANVSDIYVEKNTTEPTSSNALPIIQEEKKEEPYIEHIGIEIDEYDSSKRRAGDFVFTQSEIFHDKLFQDYGEYITETPDRVPKINPQPTYIVPLGTKVRAITGGTVEKVTKLYSDDYGIMIIKDENSPYKYELEHVINVKVKPGDTVVAGQVIAEASPHNSKGNSGYGLFEIGILRGGPQPTHVCPYKYLDESVKQEYFKKILGLYAAWEKYRKNSDIYDEKKYVTPGCIMEEEIQG